MREKLNDNPLLQAALLGVLAIVVGFMFLTRVSGGPEAPEPGATVPGATDPAAVAAVPGVDPATAGSGTQAPAPDAPAPSGQNAGGGAEFVAGPGLPKEVAAAYKDDKVVALLVIREHPQNCFKSSRSNCAGFDDQKLVQIVNELRSRSDTAVFVTHAFGLSRYSRIVTGVDIDRTPALVVVQPQNLTQGPLPTATVDYGFRGKDSVVQAVRDALYDGRDDLPYHPG